MPRPTTNGLVAHPTIVSTARTSAGIASAICAAATGTSRSRVTTPDRSTGHSGGMSMGPMIPDQVTGPTASRAGVRTARRTATTVLPTVSTAAATHTTTHQSTVTSGIGRSSLTRL